MNGSTNPAFLTVFIGIGATGVMDVWGLVAARFFNFPAPNYALVGRWIGHMAYGRFRHDAIAKSAAIRAERMIGWAAHYAIGIAFAALLVILFGPAWTRAPTLFPALLIGIATLAAPFLVMQPGMGAGIAASRTPDPSRARLRSVLTHVMFGAGLYGAGLVAAAVLP